MENVESCSSSSNYSANYVRVNRTPTPATLLPEDLNEILTDADLQEEANKRMQEEKDAVGVWSLFLPERVELTVARYCRLV